jgi:hypothetical protein
VDKQDQALQELKLEALGFSERSGSTKFLPGGTDKLPGDFVRPLQLVSVEQAAVAALTTQVGHSSPRHSCKPPHHAWLQGRHQPPLHLRV